MQSIGAVRLTKIKITKDKQGSKFATIELTRVLDEEDKITDLQETMALIMKERGHVSKVRLSEHVPKQNLIFWSAPGIDKPSDMIHCVELSNFRLSRDGEPDSSEAEIIMSFEFTSSLEDARRWLIPAVGDDIYLAIEEAQMRLGTAAD